MVQDEDWKDRLFRYQWIYRTRRSKKQKQRFIRSLVTDITKNREDLKIIAYALPQKRVLQNIYVGDVEKADHIICTYYDTPACSIGPYIFFNRKVQAKQTFRFTIISSIIMAFFGLIGIFLYMQGGILRSSLLSPKTLLFIALLVLYFLFLKKTTEGLSSRRNLVRNTSSILTQLDLLKTFRQKKVAFAFVDEYCFGDDGLSLLREHAKESATILFLDSVGANEKIYKVAEKDVKMPLDGVGNQKLPQFSLQTLYYILSGHPKAKTGKAYFLTEEDLCRRKLSEDSIKQVEEMIKDILEGGKTTKKK